MADDCGRPDLSNVLPPHWLSPLVIGTGPGGEAVDIYDGLQARFRFPPTQSHMPKPLTIATLLIAVTWLCNCGNVVR